MDIRTQTALLAAIVSMSFGLSVLLRPGRARVVTLYSVLSFSVGLFYLSRFVGALVTPAAGYPWLTRVASGAIIIFAALVPSFALSFFLEFLGVSPALHQIGRSFSLLTILVGLTVGLTPLSYSSWARSAVAVWVIIALLFSVSLLLRRMRQSESRIDRARLMYLAIGAALCILFSVLDLLAGFWPRIPTLGPVVCTLFLFFLAQTLLRLRLMDLHELLGKIASQTVLAAVLAAVFAVLTIWVKGNRALFIFNTVVAAFVMLVLLEPLREKIDDQVVALFFRERFQLLQSLGQLRSRMASFIDVNKIAALVLDALNETRRITHASLYLMAEDRPGYRLLDSRGPAPANFLDSASARGLLAAIAQGQKAVLLENIERRAMELRARPEEGKRGRDELRRLGDIRQALNQMKSGICVPLVANDRVIGFLNLWDERVPEAYASDEIALVLEIAERLSIVIENSKLYDRMLERDRLAALGEMAAGLAHEIRNPLGAIKGSAQCLDPSKLGGEDREFLEVIVEEVNRLNGVVTQFLDYSRPLKQSFGPTDINEVVTRTLKLIQNDIPEQITLTMELSDPLPKVSADAEQLKQVLINVVQNAVQAMSGKGTISLRTVAPERFHDFRAGSEWVELQVTDTGPGIPSDQQQNIFIPFYTTKQKGTGLGLAISQRLVKSHGGTISVHSRVNEGTTFTIRLPALLGDGPPDAVPQDRTPYPGALHAAMLALPSTPNPAGGPANDRKRGKDKRRRRA
jgi:signal transduction histidine kinase